MAQDVATGHKLDHAVFLTRVGELPPSAPAVRLGQGAFLVLRLADLLAADRVPIEPDVFRYQWTATERYCGELAHEGTEAAHLNGIVHSLAEAYRQQDVRLVVPSLFAYVYFLEKALRLEEALDVVDTLMRVGGARLSTKDSLAAHLRLGLLSRNLALFEAADAAYTTAEALALEADDGHAVLLARIGRAIGLMQRGNLPESERQLTLILADAQAAGQRDPEARAAHVLGNVLVKRGRPADGAPHLWRAYELYEDDSATVRALSDLGFALQQLGDISAAERALREVVRRASQPDVVLNAKIELMHCASHRRDQLGFERVRAGLQGQLDTMLPNVLTDFYLKAGIGSARFGNMTRANQLLDEALAVAGANGLHEFEFRIERIKQELGDGAEAAELQPYAVTEPVVQNAALREVSASLALLEV
jgi:tetratricopeptide (TPR) repeat protein